MRTHVTLVDPSYPRVAHQHPPFTPLGIGYLAAVLEENQYEVDVVDCQALRLSYDGFESEISKRQPDVVGVTFTTLTYKSALRMHACNPRTGFPKVLSPAHLCSPHVRQGRYIRFFINTNSFRTPPSSIQIKTSASIICTKVI